ncbi:MAG: PA14 domain-containing protein [Bacteroidota bacterium]
MKNFAWLGLLLTVCLFGCSDSHDHHGPERGRDPWVFRSVLDERARMVTLALSSDMWAAYDAQNCALYKVWKDGVILDGPVYTTAHGPQPTSKGDAFIQGAYFAPWHLLRGADTLSVNTSYKGHRFYGEHVRLQYEMTLKDGSVISIQESPEYVVDKSGHPGYERTFYVSGQPSGTDLILQANMDHLYGSGSFSTNGKFNQTSSEGTVYPGAHIFAVKGELTLKENGTTQLTSWFYPDFPKKETATLASAEEVLSPAEVLIEQSGCKTCHNTKLKTVGPSYVSVAEKYPNNEATVKQLANKVIQGGNGVWGEAMMISHLDLPYEDVATMIEWILTLDGEEAPSEGGPPPGLFPFWEKPSSNMSVSGEMPDPESLSGDGIALNVYQINGMNGLPEITEEMAPVASGTIDGFNLVGDDAFGGFDEKFYMRFEGSFNMTAETNTVFKLISDDGSRLTINGELICDNDGLHGPELVDGEVILKKGENPFVLEYFQGGGGKVLSLLWAPYGSEDFGLIPSEILTYNPASILEPKPFVIEEEGEEPKGPNPGNTIALEDVHPSFNISQARPDNFHPKVGGMDFMSDGSLILSNWDPEGSIYRISNLEQDDPEKIVVTPIASGLAEPLGVKVVDDEIYVLQKQELTKLTDHDGDQIIDEYETVCNGWQVSANFHEFAFGLVYKDGHFYATLATAINPGGASTRPQIPDRGKAVKISKEDGSFEFMAHGLRTPNGIGIGVDGEIYIADNQGDWLPASKIVHLEDGDFFGSRSVDFEGTARLREKLPVVWLPQDEIGNSPTQPTYLNVGPYEGQMIHGEVTHGGLKRVFAEKVNGEYQGCVFRFTQGLEAGVNRVVWSPDGDLYIGGVGSTGNWGHAGKLKYGLQRLSYNGNTAFEMLAVRAQPDGLEIEFTEPLAAGFGEASDFTIRQWYYLPTENYGGPKLDDKPLAVQEVSLSADRKKATLKIAGIQPNHVVYVLLNPAMKSSTDQSLWTTEAWYTMNQIPRRGAGALATN